MTTERQIESNRQNAQKSTGPQTQDGKDISRRNSLKHGLAGRGVIAPELDETRIEERIQEWAPHFPQLTGKHSLLLSQLVRAFVRVERADLEEIAIRARAAERATDLWESDRAFEAQMLATKLKKKPQLIAAQLEQSSHGCAWKRDRWVSLAEVVACGHAWSDTHQSLALDLLGCPSEFRCITKIDLRTTDASPEAMNQHRLTVIDAEIVRLEDLINGPHARVERRDREFVMAGITMCLDPEVNRVDRYGAASRRQLDKVMDLVKDAGKGVFKVSKPEAPQHDDDDFGPDIYDDSDRNDESEAERPAETLLPTKPQPVAAPICPSIASSSATLIVKTPLKALVPVVLVASGSLSSTQPVSDFEAMLQDDPNTRSKSSSTSLTRVQRKIKAKLERQGAR